VGERTSRNRRDAIVILTRPEEWGLEKTCGRFVRDTASLPQTITLQLKNNLTLTSLSSTNSTKLMLSETKADHLQMPVMKVG
jgi:hypothetical protein